MFGARLEYTLGYPNLEVESALNDSLLKALVGPPGQVSEPASRLYEFSRERRTLAGFETETLEC